MTVYTLSSGIDTSLSTKLNANLNFLSKQAIIGRLNSDIIKKQKLSDVGQFGPSLYETQDSANVYPIIAGDSYLSDLVYDKSSTSWVDTAASTCLYSELGFAAFCDVLDLFDDASINTGIWSTTVAGAGTVTESGGNLDLNANSNGGVDNAIAISSGASGLDLHGQNTEVLIAYEIQLAGGSGTHTCSAQIQISNGSTHVTVAGSPSTPGSGVNYLERGLLRITYDHSNTRCDVWRINLREGGTTGNAEVLDWATESVVSDNTSVAGVTTNKYIRFLAEANQTTGSQPTARVIVYAVGYRKNGAGAGDAVFASSSNTMSSTSSKGFVYPVWFKAPASDPTINFSANGGTNYSSDNVHKVWGSTGNSGTSFKAKITSAKPTTISADTKNIAVLMGWGAFYG